jgi:hypothetical protein
MQDEAKGCEKKFIYSLIVVIMDFIKYACSELYGANLILLNLNCTTSKIRGGVGGTSEYWCELYTDRRSLE